MSHFQTRVKNFFAIQENFFSRRPFGRGRLVGANGFMRLFDPTVKHFYAKIEKMFSNRQKGAHASWIADFQSAVETIRLCAKKVKYFMLSFIQYEKQMTNT